MKALKKYLQGMDRVTYLCKRKGQHCFQVRLTCMHHLLIIVQTAAESAGADNRNSFGISLLSVYIVGFVLMMVTVLSEKYGRLLSLVLRL